MAVYFEKKPYIGEENSTTRKQKGRPIRGQKGFPVDEH